MGINRKIEALLFCMKLAPGTSSEMIDEAGKILNFLFPPDYRAFMLFSNGACGEIGDEYIEIWPIDEVVQSNHDMDVVTYAPGLIAFGGDGGNELYGFDTRTEAGTIVQVPMIGLDWADAWPIATSFDNFVIQKSAQSAS